MSAAPTYYSRYAGCWYPSDSGELEALIDRLMSESASRVREPLLPGGAGFVVPHAGPEYSGRVAAAVYRHFCKTNPRAVILLGFAHRGASPGLWIPEAGGYATPLGETTVDETLRSALLRTGVFRAGPMASFQDHSVEIQLPFLQRVCPGVPIVPVYVSRPEASLRKLGAEALADIADWTVPVVASSDFTHYGDAFSYRPFPVDKQTPARLRTLDEALIDAAGTLDPEFLLRTLSSESATVCGREPIALLLEILGAVSGREDFFQFTLDYETSGDITGDYSHCVSYAALGYYPWPAIQLTETEGELLLESARQTLRNLQDTGLPRPIPPPRLEVGLLRRAGAFVTIHQGGDLRGCIGRVTSQQPLAELIPQLTLAAATEDSRFRPIGRGETGINIEISILSPMKLLPNLDRFRIGVDGGLLQTSGQTGLLLPQVAHGHTWTAADFLAAVARKTHVSSSVYQDPATLLYTFRAQVIS